jgi:CDP-glucose 4,6-dehydratase
MNNTVDNTPSHLRIPATSHPRNFTPSVSSLFHGVYAGKRVLVTGNTGFKGSWLVLWLLKLGANVRGYSLNLPTDPNHHEILNLDFETISGDVRNLEKLQKAIESFQPDIVFHMAAQSLVRKSYESPVETFETNVIGTINVFEACRLIESVRAIVNVTSDKCYENKEWIWGYRENDPVGGHDPYSASKGCAEIVTKSYRKSFFPLEEYQKSHQTLVTSVRAGNVIGGGDWGDDRLVPDIIRAHGSMFWDLYRDICFWENTCLKGNRSSPGHGILVRVMRDIETCFPL